MSLDLESRRICVHLWTRLSVQHEADKIRPEKRQNGKEIRNNESLIIRPSMVKLLEGSNPSNMTVWALVHW